jgi:hypothetical protein
MSPLRGFTCPPGGEEPGRRNTIDYCLGACKKPCVMPPLLGAMWGLEHNNIHIGDYISASMLAGEGCPRQTVNERYTSFWDEPRRRFWPFRGTIAHKMCEGSDTLIAKYGWLQEVTLLVPLEYDEPAPVFELRADDTGALVKTFTGDYDSTQKLVVNVRGTFDAYNPYQSVLADLKSMAWYKVMATIKGTKKGLYSKNLEDSHVLQFNFYRWLISKTVITDEQRETFRSYGLPALKGKTFPAPKQLVMQAIEMMELPRSGGTYALKERGATTLYDIDPVPVLPLHEIEAIVRPRALQWYKWLVLRQPTPVVPEESDWLCKNCQFNGELLTHGSCFPSKERAALVQITPKA